MGAVKFKSLIKWIVVDKDGKLIDNRLYDTDKMQHDKNEFLIPVLVQYVKDLHTQKDKIV